MTPFRFFSRQIKKAIVRADLKEKRKRIEARKTGLDWSVHRIQMTPELLASKTRTRPIPLPAPLLSKFHSVFSKYKRLEIYNKGNAYMKLYTIMVASEQPTNLDKLSLPFQNSTDLQSALPQLHYQPSKRKDKLEKRQSEQNDQIESGQSTSSVNKQDDQVVVLNYDQNMVIAYMARKYVESYNIMNRMLHEISLKYPNFDPKSCFDFGAGASPSGSCFAERFPNAELVFAVEPNAYMRKMGRFLTKDKQSFVWAENVVESAYLGENKQFDVTVCSFVLEEVKSAGERQKIVEMMLERTSDNGFALFVLPGTPMGFRYLNDLRERIRKESRDDWNIIAPCPHHERCPLANSGQNWCRFEQDWPRFPKSVLPKLPSERMLIRSKFCYLVVRKGAKGEGRTTAAEQSLDWDRIIRPVKRKGRHSVVFLCNRKGEVEQRVVAKSHERQFGYKESKRLKWGDLWKFPLRLPNRFRRESRNASKEGN